MEELSRSPQYEIEVAEEIRDRMRGRMDPQYNTTLGSFLSDAVSPVAIELEIKNGEIADVLKLQDIYFHSGEDLTNTVFQRTGIKRKLATHAMVDLIFVGYDGTIIPKDTLVTSDTVQFVTIEDVEILNNQANVQAVAIEEGSIGNVSQNSITKVITSITGVTSVNNNLPASGGYDEESDAELLERYFDKLQKPGLSGNVYHYRDWAKEINGVGEVYVTPLWDGPLTVKVNLTDIHGLPAGTNLVDQVKDHIEEERPFGAVVTVEPAEKVGLNITVDVKYDKNYEVLEKEAINEEIKQSINEHLGLLAFKENEVSASRIGCLILNTAGIKDYKNLNINGKGPLNVTTKNIEVAVLNTLNISEVM